MIVQENVLRAQRSGRSDTVRLAGIEDTEANSADGLSGLSAPSYSAVL